MFTHQDFDGHETVAYFTDEVTGLKAIIAIHNTHLGQAMGGCRIYKYPSDEEALTDVLRLSKGMTYKSALAGLKLGGGKSVIIGDPHKDKNQVMMEAFASFLNRLNGAYIAAEDSGTSVKDLLQVAEKSPYVAGIEGRPGIDGLPCHGDPSPATAYGVYMGMKTAVHYRFSKESLRDMKIAIQGVGNVGFHLAKHLREEGARLFVADVYDEAVDRAVKELGAKAVATEDIHRLDVDIFAPCAMGAIINDTTITEIKAKIIAGAANNQLSRPYHGDHLREKGILYAPDYAINAGGIIDVFYEREGYDPELSKKHIEGIADTLMEIFRRADRKNISTALVADQLAEERFAVK